MKSHNFRGMNVVATGGRASRCRCSSIRTRFGVFRVLDEKEMHGVNSQRIMHGFKVYQLTKVSNDGRVITVDGQRRIILSGSIHYPRNTSDAHEPLPYEYDFSGNLSGLLKPFMMKGFMLLFVWGHMFVIFEQAVYIKVSKHVLNEIMGTYRFSYVVA
ncbi:Glycoside hydrolase, catalytic domain-containing protein [Cynara cardunculus var. scolymus]|uniref:Glycoside hydrolase, catalytic domain-containing protein n=1 Tax=Cynara cardunculus var. scolymus TaxID=59895 RepID=A0A118JU78_CYNCS|nr:Glycoside hydrolase, catalytic domain-containing protein [Cynara cardunculus var. scolymus]